MFLELTGQNVSVTKGIRYQINRKISKLDHLSHMPTKLHLVLSVDNRGHNHTIHALMHLPQNEIFAAATSDDMYKTVDLVLIKLKKQLAKAKDKMVKH